MTANVDISKISIKRYNMTRLILIRHGESEANRNSFFAGQMDVELLKKGEEQAKKTAEYIMENYNVKKVYASDLKRAYKTGEIISEALGVEIIKNQSFREIYAGRWQGKTFDNILKKYTDDYSVWLNDIGNSRCTEGESVKELGERVLKALLKVAEENEDIDIVIATHATPIRVVECILSGCQLSEMKNVSWVPNASVTEVLYTDGNLKLGNVGFAEHLMDLKTEFAANV